MAECPSCGKTLTGKICACGYAVRPTNQAKEYRSEPQAAVRRAVAEREREVNAFVAKYQQEHPGATKKEACFAYMKRKGVLGNLPQHIREDKPDFDDVMDEYRESIEA